MPLRMAGGEQKDDENCGGNKISEGVWVVYHSQIRETKTSNLLCERDE